MQAKNVNGKKLLHHNFLFIRLVFNAVLSYFNKDDHHYCPHVDAC